MISIAPKWGIWESTTFVDSRTYSPNGCNWHDIYLGVAGVGLDWISENSNVSASNLGSSHQNSWCAVPKTIRADGCGHTTWSCSVLWDCRIQMVSSLLILLILSYGQPWTEHYQAGSQLRLVQGTRINNTIICMIKSSNKFLLDPYRGNISGTWEPRHRNPISFPGQTPVYSGSEGLKERMGCDGLLAAWHWCLMDIDG